MALLVALWFWGLSMWFFLVSVGSLWKYLRARKGMPFQMTWWSFVFPNTALVSFTDFLVVLRVLISHTFSDSHFWWIHSRLPPLKLWGISLRTEDCSFLDVPWQLLSSSYGSSSSWRWLYVSSKRNCSGRSRTPNLAFCLFYLHMIDSDRYPLYPAWLMLMES